MKQEINTLRNNVDVIDKNIINLLIERKALTDRIINIKKSLNISVFDNVREVEIINNLKNEFSDTLNPKLIEHVLREVLFYSKSDTYKLNSIEKLDLNELLDKHPFLIAGPCTVESESQITEIADQLLNSGIRLLRGGAFKPRTSPFSFQGLEDDGLRLLKKTASERNMFVVSEFTDSRQLEELYDYVDIIQIGSRNMFSYGFLKQIGKKTAKDKKPILLKRNFNSTIQEFLFSAQYIINEGNNNVLLCLRGIRTFEQINSLMRNTPDLASILELRELTDLKIIYDPSHATGDAKFVVSTALAALQLGADGLIIETHTNPQNAVVDGKQSIEPSELDKVIDYINRNY
jgi:3-deoxy-7-phosphoheptulonate synthase